MGWCVSPAVLHSCQIKLSHPQCRDAVPIRTKSGMLIALLARWPNHTSWDKMMARLTASVDLTKDAMSFHADQSDHHWGKYPTIVTGISYGGGAMASPGLAL